MICFQEVPNEVSLSFSISNCPNRCKGCHSPYLQNDIGEPLLPKLQERIEYYKGLITCVLFMGGDDEKQYQYLVEAINICKKQNLKVALYSGRDIMPSEILGILNYIKIGHYDEKLGGLKIPATNQRMYKIENGNLKDITYMFWNK